MRYVYVFDVNETLLDLSVLDGEFERIFGDRQVRVQWFGQFIQSALVATVTNHYSDFGTIGRAALEMIAARRNMLLTDADRTAILGRLTSLPPHPEVPAALARLKAAGGRVAALTNSTARVATAQLTNAGIADQFEQILSADAVQRLKPAAEAYQMAAEQLKGRGRSAQGRLCCCFRSPARHGARSTRATARYRRQRSG
jgi:2-haloacid dehalogenase